MNPDTSAALGSIPAGTPTVSPNDFTVRVRLLYDPRGTLLIESAAETTAKYDEMRDDARVRFAAEPEKELAAQITRLDAACKQELDLFAQLEKARGTEATSYDFSFRVPTIADHEAAESEASQMTPRQELVYRRVLAQRTFLATNYPAFTTFLALRTDVALHIMRQVAARVTMTQDVRAFLSFADAS